MGEEFACPVCDSPAIVYPEEGEEDRVCAAAAGRLSPRATSSVDLLNNTQRCRPADARQDSQA
jgi:hypothetical protein